MIRFGKIISFIYDLLPLIAIAESMFGKGRGTQKKSFVEEALRATTALSRRFGENDLDPAFKEMRPTAIDASVQLAQWLGLIPASEGQRVAAGVALGLVDRLALAAYKKSSAGEELSESETAAWAGFEKAAAAIPRAS